MEFKLISVTLQDSSIAIYLILLQRVFYQYFIYVCGRRDIYKYLFTIEYCD